MNLYFVLEGEKTEVKLYPKWIEYVLPELKQVYFEKDVISNNYYIFSGGGIPSIYNHIINSIKNINDNPIFDKLIVCLDGEEIGTEKRIEIVKRKIEEAGVEIINNCEIVFIVQNVCIETWFLGNRKIVKRNPDPAISNSNLDTFLNHFNVINEDPEFMGKIEGHRNKADSHFLYLREIFKEHNLRYSKSNPKLVLEKTYFDELLKRTEESTHLPTLKYFLDFLSNLRIQILKK